MVFAVLLLLAGCSKADSSQALEGGAPKLQIVEATFGLNCQGIALPSPWRNTVVPGNATEKVRAACDNQVGSPRSCSYVMHLDFIPDPAPTCMKGFDIKWRCDEQLQSTHLDVSTDGAELSMSCAPLLNK